MTTTKFSAETIEETIAAQHAGLERLEEKLAHELLDDEERQELRDRVLRLRRKEGE